MDFCRCFCSLGGIFISFYCLSPGCRTSVHPNPQIGLKSKKHHSLHSTNVYYLVHGGGNFNSHLQNFAGGYRCGNPHIGACIGVKLHRTPPRYGCIYWYSYLTDNCPRTRRFAGILRL